MAWCRWNIKGVNIIIPVYENYMGEPVWFVSIDIN